MIEQERSASKVCIRIRRDTAYIKVIRKMNTIWETHKFEHYIFSLLLAVEVIMSFTFLGYMHIPPISITTAYIPIVIIACLFGPAESSSRDCCSVLAVCIRLPRLCHACRCGLFSIPE